MTDSERLYKLNYIWHAITQEELLAQLAEEGAELTHAALKLRRALNGTNPTPVSVPEAVDALMEEIADVMLLVNLFFFGQYEEEEIANIMDAKLQRWEKRLTERKESKK